MEIGVKNHACACTKSRQPLTWW